MPKNSAAGVNELPEDEDQLANVFKCHVLLEKMIAEQLQNNQAYTTWQEKASRYKKWRPDHHLWVSRHYTSRSGWQELRGTYNRYCFAAALRLIVWPDIP